MGCTGKGDWKMCRGHSALVELSYRPLQVGKVTRQVSERAPLEVGWGWFSPALTSSLAPGAVGTPKCPGRSPASHLSVQAPGLLGKYRC